MVFPFLQPKTVDDSYVGNMNQTMFSSAARKMAKQHGFDVWQSPTSDGSGEMFYRKKSDEEGVDYLYKRNVSLERQRGGMFGMSFGGNNNSNPDDIVEYGPTVTKYETNDQGPFGGIPQQVRYRTKVTYQRDRLAPGQSPRGYRQEQTPRRYKATEEQGGSRSYATRRSQSGARGTILTGRQGTNLGSGNRKTVLGG